MNDTPMTPNDFSRAVELIPRHLKNSLSEADSAWMKEFLTQLQSTDPAQAKAFVEEMQWVEKTQAQMERALPHLNLDAGWQHLTTKLEDSSAPASASAISRAATPAQDASRNKAASWIKTFIQKRIEGLLNLWRKPAVVVLGSAMIVGQMGMLAAVIKKMYTVETAGVAIPASGAKGAASDQVVVVQVIFKDNTKVADIRKLLAASGAQIIGGPSAIGVWEVQIDKSMQTAAIDQISKSKTVESISLP